MYEINNKINEKKKIEMDRLKKERTLIDLYFLSILSISNLYLLKENNTLPLSVFNMEI